jgi:hypothetical protein
MRRSLTQYHPCIGYTYIPNLACRVAHDGGGYLLRTNTAGFRCEHEFVSGRRPGRRRVLLFGDSQTAGDGVSNAQRFGDRLEGLVPDVEVYNFGLPSSGTDQQYLAYKTLATQMEHDLLMIVVNVENIGRVAARYRPFFDDRDRLLYYAKPYYQREADGTLTLHHVPVPKQPLSDRELALQAAHLDRGLAFPRLRSIARALGVRDVAQRVSRFQPVPDYESPENPKWLLLRGILEHWIRTSAKPVLLVPLPLFPFVEETADPSPYQARFRELARDVGCTVHDVLADLRRYPPEHRRTFRFHVDVHFTSEGHRVLAESLARPVATLLDRRAKRPREPTT